MTNMGWVCPKCDRAVSPAKDYCDCAPAVVVATPFPVYPNSTGQSRYEWPGEYTVSPFITKTVWHSDGLQ